MWIRWNGVSKHISTAIRHFTALAHVPPSAILEISNQTRQPTTTILRYYFHFRNIFFSLHNLIEQQSLPFRYNNDFISWTFVNAFCLLHVPIAWFMAYDFFLDFFFFIHTFNSQLSNLFIILLMPSSAIFFLFLISSWATKALTTSHSSLQCFHIILCQEENKNPTSWMRRNFKIFFNFSSWFDVDHSCKHHDQLKNLFFFKHLYTFK